MMGELWCFHMTLFEENNIRAAQASIMPVVAHHKVICTSFLPERLFATTDNDTLKVLVGTASTFSASQRCKRDLHTTLRDPIPELRRLLQPAIALLRTPSFTPLHSAESLQGTLNARVDGALSSRKPSSH